MKEYIERAQLLKNIGHDEKRRADVLPGSTFDIVLKEPAADVAPVRHGRWIAEEKESISKRNRYIKYAVYSCSTCGRSNGRIKKKYCPNCGARMDGEETPACHDGVCDIPGVDGREAEE